MPGQLMDIRGLDPISWWPPAPGWWISTLLLLLTLFLLSLLLRYLLRYPPGSWRWEARAELRDLWRQRNKRPQKESAARLSELLRRIAIARFGRERIASLSGPTWLQWLQQSDPNGFDWSGLGGSLLKLPYAPESHNMDPGELDALISAAIDLVAHSYEGSFIGKIAHLGSSRV
ncbi:MAG: DUF4381 domain-containing protein [Gammaproteobacteria bacterium]|nr:DUF4381 domain-containing protein [Gammaproteobacteria bacterium]